MDKWDTFGHELGKMENLNHYSIISFWKERLQEETELFKRKILSLEDEIKRLKEMAERYASDSKIIYQRLCDTERRFDYERTIVEEKLKAREAELKLERSNGENLKKLLAALQSKPDNAISGDVEREVLPQIMQERNALKQKIKELQDELTSAKASDSETEGLCKIKFFKERESAHLIDLENLARGFAHKVRNYLGIISGTAQMITSRSKLSQEDKEQIDLIEQNAREMLGSIEEFLSLAKIPELHYASASINDVLNAVTLALGDALKTAGADVEKKLGENIPKVQIDERLIGEVLQHLLNNAAESMPSGGIIAVQTSYNAEQELVVLKVIDKGKGISDNHIKKVYQPYFTTKKGHKGLGLTLCRRIAELHHGLMDIETKKDTGTIVTFSLPLTQE